MTSLRYPTWSRGRALFGVSLFSLGLFPLRLPLLKFLSFDEKLPLLKYLPFDADFVLDAFHPVFFPPSFPFIAGVRGFFFLVFDPLSCYFLSKFNPPPLPHQSNCY